MIYWSYVQLFNICIKQYYILIMTSYINSFNIFAAVKQSVTKKKITSSFFKSLQ